MKILFSSFLLCLTFSLAGQDQKFFKYRQDLSINVTSLISNVISLGDNTTPNAFGVNYRIKNDKLGFRMGLNAVIGSKTDFDNPSGSVDLKERALKARLGFEKYTKLSKSFLLGFGFDAIGIFEDSKSSNSFDFVVQTTKIGYGAGPAIRLEYKLGPHISLSTESTLYAIGSRRTKKLEENGIPTFNKSANEFDLTTVIPSILFLNIHF